MMQKKVGMGANCGEKVFSCSNKCEKCFFPAAAAVAVEFHPKSIIFHVRNVFNFGVKNETAFLLTIILLYYHYSISS
jgi:hypothetical protein